MTTNPIELVEKLPTIQPCVEYIEDNYPVVKGKPVEVIKVIEYPEIFKVNQVVKIEKEDFAIVVEVNKKTG